MRLIRRDEYMDWLSNYRDKQIIKVLTGLRRVGKSTIFTLFIEELRKQGVPDEQIVFINFEEIENERFLDRHALYDHIISKRNGKKLYVFLDEIQRVEKFEEVVNSLFVKEDIDVYLTGSNAKFLSSEIATFLTGRYVEIDVLPVSFREYCAHFDDGSKSRRDLFTEYVTYGAMPGSYMFESGSSAQREYIRGVYKTILEKDVLKRNSAATRQVVENILSYVVYNIGCLTSARKITDRLNANGVRVAYNTVAGYLETLRDCRFIYKADRYDVAGKRYLKLINKYYVTDFGFRYHILNNRTVELPQLLENLVFLELKRRRCKIATGKVDDREVDFIVRGDDDRLKYIQVAVTVMSEDKLRQELAVFDGIRDNYPKYIITLDDYFAKDHDGVTTINAIDFLLGERL